METLIKKTIHDIEGLVDNLEYLKTFLEKIPDEKEFEIYSKIGTIHTEIILLSGKLNYKKG